MLCDVLRANFQPVSPMAGPAAWPLQHGRRQEAMGFSSLRQPTVSVLHIRQSTVVVVAGLVCAKELTAPWYSSRRLQSKVAGKRSASSRGGTSTTGPILGVPPTLQVSGVASQPTNFLANPAMAGCHGAYCCRCASAWPSLFRGAETAPLVTPRRPHILGSSL